MSTGRETVQICAKRRMPICVARNRRDQEAASSWHSQWHPGRARRHGHRGGRCEAVEAAPSHVQLGPAARLLDPGGARDRLVPEGLGRPDVDEGRREAGQVLRLSRGCVGRRLGTAPGSGEQAVPPEAIGGGGSEHFVVHGIGRDVGEQEPPTVPVDADRDVRSRSS
jgi:hypothetical protein